MNDRPTRLSTRIDFDQSGKQCDYLRLPHSVHRSAYGWLPVPLVSVKNGGGPTVLLMSGIHGDEYEGQVALSRLIRDARAEDVSGQLIILPMANYPAAKAGLRTSPIDDLNMNRVFPGDPDGSATQALAHYVDSELIARADYVIDLHSGGSSLMYLPSVILGRGSMPADKQAEIMALGHTFGAPYGFIFPAGQGGGATTQAATTRRGAIHIGTEMGGTGTVTPEILRICEGGVRRLLRQIGAWHGAVGDYEAPAVKTRMLHAPDWDSFVYAGDDGLFEPVVELGDEVVSGQLAGLIHTPETPWAGPTEAHFESGGLVLCKRVPGRTERGDCLFHLGADYRE